MREQERLKKSGPFDREKARSFLRFKRELKSELGNFFFIILGVLSASFGLKSFLLPNEFIDGGITGVSLLIRAQLGWSLPILIIILNVPFIILGFKQVGKNFVIKTVTGILLLAITLAVVEFATITSDKLLVAVFGGFFLGAGIGLTMRGGGVIDGTEVMAIAFSRRTGLTIGDIILLVNIIIFSYAAYVLSMETALYSILAYLSASKTVDFIIEGIEEYTGVTIISAKNEEIRIMITEKMGRGVTVYKGTRGFGKRGTVNTEIDILYSVITRLEVARLNTEILKIDPSAFVIMNSIKDTRGGMIRKKRMVHH